MNARLTPILILFGISIMGLGMSIVTHGDVRSNEDAWITILSVLINWGLLLWAIL